MSNELKEFNQNWNVYIKYRDELYAVLEKKHYNLLEIFRKQQFAKSFADFFSEQPWPGIDKATLSQFKAYFLYQKITVKGIDKTIASLRFSMDTSYSFELLTPKDTVEFLESVLAELSLCIDEIIENRTGTEILLNFLKSCVNFLISRLTFGAQPNFFKSNTFYLEKLQQIHENCDKIYRKLPEQDKTAGLTI